MKKFFPMVIFALGALSLVFAYNGRSHSVPLGPAHTLYDRQTYTANNGSVTNALDAEKVRYVKPDTTWSEVITYYSHDGKETAVVKQFSSNEKMGVFKIDDQNGQLIYLGDRLHTIHQFMIEEARKEPTFVREDKLLGHPVAVFRDTQPNGDSEEFWRAADLNGEYLRSVFANSEGVNTIETVKIAMGEPPAPLFNIPNYPVNYDLFKSMIRSAEKRGRVDEAAAMRQTLEQRMKMDSR